MIKALRVDERLVHGQIAMVWSKELKLQGLVIANDEVANNETQKMALQMAVPSGIKSIIKDIDGAINLLKNPKASEMNLMVLVKTVEDALRIAKEISTIEYVNIGNAGKMVQAEKKQITKYVMLTDSEIAALKELVDVYPESAFQAVPSEDKVLARSIIKDQKL
ncbi:PTS sugar transporter subunit IIB [Candidatus Enterococcus murrayae]|uniref:PTS sugar transporter subunit IIB n=1 Tax=Candidatus Enterococcus murrayae TaxID=2815321 RepID=A0ABS3HI85_9ENTE|nr:PTS sugar transporter subunit IIB [Enterococcus sp. MJM16]MBO0452298.1 PTS sugar transporter subunit IIB [Enterococcus sp. MJM16]